MFDKNRDYTRVEIQREVGGEIQTYLPQKNKTILAGCFNLELNPDGPLEIQAGNADKVREKAALLISQPGTVFPVFVKESRRSKNYRFVGNFRCKGGSNSTEDIAIAEQKSGRIGQLSYVLQLEMVA